MTPQQSQKQPAPGTPETLCTTCARADVNCPIYPQQTTRCVEHRAAGQQQPDHIADATEMVQGEPVNQQMLAALKRIGGMTMSMYVSAGDAMSKAKRLANEAIAAAEQAQQAEPVARNALISAMDSLREAIIDVYHESVGHSSAVEKKMRRIDISAIADRYATHTPAVAVPDGYALVPDADNMTDEIAEAIAEKCNCCGGIAYEIYCTVLAAAQKGGDA